MPSRPDSFELQPVYGTACDAAIAIRKRKISAKEMVQAAFRRIDLVNPKVNAIVVEFRERALQRATEADRVLAKGTIWGSLHGVPVTVKESFAYRGSTSTWGLEQYKRQRSQKTAPAVERLERAGAIVIGKTNVPVGLTDVQTANPIYGPTNNPWDLKRTPGGSTGGGSAALATGIGCISLGSDIGGSIRIPAHFCGVYGHKPSLGVVSTDGHEPGAWDGSPDLPMDVMAVGPLARSAEDLMLSLDVLGGPASSEANAWSWRLLPPRQKRIRDFRIGYVLDDDFAPLASDIRRVYEEFIVTLKRYGARLQRGWPKGIDPKAQFRTYEYLVLALLSLSASDRDVEAQRKKLKKDPEDTYAAAFAAPHARWLRETLRRLRFRTLWQEYFGNHDVFLLPTAFTTAFPHLCKKDVWADGTIDTPEVERPYGQLVYWISTASLTGLPATVAPVGRTSSGLPVGIQILAPIWEDATAIEFASLISKVADGFVPPPNFAL